MIEYIEKLIENNILLFTTNITIKNKKKIMQPIKWKWINNENVRNYINKNHNWYAIICKNIIVIDIDIYKDENLQRIYDEIKEYWNFKVRTGNGGYHIYFKGEIKSGNNVKYEGKNIEGLDIKSMG